MTGTHGLSRKEHIIVKLAYTELIGHQLMQHLNAVAA